MLSTPSLRNLEGKGFILSYSFQFIIQGNQGRSPVARTEAEAVKKCCLLVGSPGLVDLSFLEHSRLIAHGWNSVQ